MYTQSFESEGLRYKILSADNLTVAVAGNNKVSGGLAIPPTVSHKGKTYTVTEIGRSAFEGCTGLMSLDMPDSVTAIGVSAFSGCEGLTSVSIPDSVTAVREGAFSGCTGLTSVDIPDSVTEIGYRAFFRCTGLTSVMPGSSLTTIGDNAFEGCTGLTSVVIPGSVISIGLDPFARCENLANITVDAGNPDYCSVDGILYSKDKTLLIQCGAGKTGPVEIPDSVTAIGERAFRYCSGLTSVHIPESVTEIGYCAFEGCAGLTSVDIPGSVKAIGDWAFSGCAGLTSMTIPDSVTKIGYRALSGCTGLKGMISLNPEPPFCNGDVFGASEADIRICSRMTLYVPGGSTEAYREAEEWKKFGEIEPFDTAD